MSELGGLPGEITRGLPIQGGAVDFSINIPFPSNMALPLREYQLAAEVEGRNPQDIKDISGLDKPQENRLKERASHPNSTLILVCFLLKLAAGD